MTIMSYGGYEAAVEYDGDADLFHGEVLNLRDVVTFQGRSTEALKQAFADSIADYVAFCESRGEAPDEPFSGRLVVHVEPSLHRRAAVAAKRAGQSFEKWVANVLDHAAQ